MKTDIIQIRPAASPDIAALMRVHDAAWRLAYRGLIPHIHLERMIARRGPAWWRRGIRHSNLMVLTFDGAVQGYTSIGRSRHARAPASGEIFELYLAPAFQGVGLGKPLFMAARETLRRNRLRGLLVWALSGNEIACEFYARQGGQPLLTDTEAYGDTLLPKTGFVWPSR